MAALTRPLQPGDIVKRKTDNRLWVYVDARDHGNDVYTMNFFDTSLSKMIQYTGPFGLYLPDHFTFM